MKRTVLARRGALTSAVLISGCLLVTACGNSGSSSAAPSAGHGGAERAPAAAAPAANGPAANGPAGSGAPAMPATAAQPGKVTMQTAKLAPASQSIVYTASMTVRAANVTAAAQRAVGIVVAAGGYTADEHIGPAAPGRTGRTVGLTLKVPVPAYQQVLGQLSSPALGRQLTMQQQATDVTAQVADVNSLVTSQQDAIAALDGLLKRAASVSGLLQVQQQISADQSTLNSLLAQQRALNHETSYGTVSMTLLGPRRAAPHGKPAPPRDFLTGLAAGWRALRHATGLLLTALGAALPFLIVIMALAGIGYAAWRRVIRRRAGPTAAN